MNIPTTAAPVCNTIPIQTAQRFRRLRRSRCLTLPTATVTPLGICFLIPGPARIVADIDPRPVPTVLAGDMVDVPTGTGSRGETKAPIENECVAQVCQSTGKQGEIAVGDPRSVYTQVSGSPDNSQPSTQLVDTGGWATTISSGSRPAGPLEVVHDKGHVTYTPVFGDSLTTNIDQIGEAHLVHDRNANAWYSLDNTTVTAMGEAATQHLVGPIKLCDYREILCKRVGFKPKTSAARGEERSTMGGWAIRGPVLATVIVGIVTVIIAVRHERKVIAPLHRACNRTDMVKRTDRFSRDEPDARDAVARRGIPCTIVNLLLLGDGVEDSADVTAGETLGDAIPESHVSLPWGLRA